MKRIGENKKLFKVEGEIDLKALKKTYREMIKEWHPDKFQEEDKKEEAELMSQKIIEGYEFLVSIAPETKAANLDEYIATTTKSRIADFQHKSMTLEITFADGNTYEYFGVDKKMFAKLVNSDTPYRFGKRSIFNKYLYRKSKKEAIEA